ncbi:MAG TPA: hypothetical protein VG297_08555 [Bryobacteraceae bacterium]|nr:hypothetical protein [Bryobacteraceae bacterium]
MSIFENNLRRVCQAGFLICSTVLLLNADTLTLRNGATVQGTYLGGSAREVRMDQNGSVRTYDIGQVQSVIFSEPARDPGPPPQASYPPPRADRGNDRAADRRDDDRPPQAAGLTIPTDTPVTIRMIEAVNSDTARLGQTFRASLDEPVVVDGQEVIPRGADVLTKLVEDQQSGKIQGRTVLTLALSTITVNGRPLDVTSTDVKTESSSRGARSGKVIGGATALGAIIGAVAGGGKGAAIGAGSGAAVGTGAQVMTGGQKVKIPSETRLTFRLQSPVQL